MTPCPTYERLGVKDQSQFCAKFLPNNGIENTTGKKYARSFFFGGREERRGKKNVIQHQDLSVQISMEQK